MAVLELCLILYAVPALLWAHYADLNKQDRDITRTFVPVIILGGIAGFIVNEILEKKLSPEKYSALVDMIRAVLLLLVVLIAIAGIWRFGRSMGLL